MNTCIIVFAKAPIKGNVKTRLARDIGATDAVACYCAMLADLSAKLIACRVPVFYFVDRMSSLFPWQYSHIQQGKSLAQRMAHAFTQLYAKGFGSGILIGSDIPTLMPHTLEKALTLLSHHDAVLAPSQDGGYTLIGLHAGTFHKNIFTPIQHKEHSVYKHTLALLHRRNLLVATLDTQLDIDNEKDLQKFLKMDDAASYSPLLHEYGETYNKNT